MASETSAALSYPVRFEVAYPEEAGGRPGAEGRPDCVRALCPERQRDLLVRRRGCERRGRKSDCTRHRVVPHRSVSGPAGAAE